MRFLRESPRSFAYAVLAHLALLAVLVFSLDWSPAPSIAHKPAPIQAVAIDAHRLDAEIERKKQVEAARQLKKRQAEQARLEREKKKKQLAEQKRRAEKQHRAEQKKKAEAEKQRQAVLAHKKAEAEKRRKAEQKKKAEAEKKRKAEVTRKKAEAEKKRKAEAARKKAEAEKKRKAEEARKKAAAEREMRERLAAEQERLRAQRESAMQRIVDQYGLYIKEKVQRSWIRPSGSNASLSCTVNVRLIPGGEVVDVKIVRGSGNEAFDRSVEAAVFRASPLPVPKDPEVMEKFRSITFEFNPDS